MVQVPKELKTVYNKTYYIKHRNKLMDNMKIKYKCEVCKCEVNHLQKQRHYRTKKHLKNNQSSKLKT